MGRLQASSPMSFWENFRSPGVDMLLAGPTCGIQGCHESVLAQQKQGVHPLNPPASLGKRKSGVAMTFCGSQTDSNDVQPVGNGNLTLSDYLHFFEVLPLRTSYNSRHLLPGTNYCTCKYFEKQVMKRKNRMTCAHFLAAWLSLCFNSCTSTTVKERTVALIAQQMMCRSQEFF
ncbi:hypothetical protein RB195_023119 [Necator americanus]|uniref:SWIM-type domain-containing protein n=1 Tax=Necator americanus TaxID=51031 RepID=A0ABR1EHX4_NECAM